MSSAINYLAGAIAYRYAFENPNTGAEFPTDPSKISGEVQSYYDVVIEERFFEPALHCLRNFGLIDFSDDKYAGKTISYSKVNLDNKYSKLSEDRDLVGFAKIDSAKNFYQRVLANKQFWVDLDSEISSSEGNFEESSNSVPASDRIVTITHNSEESQIVVGAISSIIDDLQTNNEIAAEAGDSRERWVAEGKASLELISGEKVSWLKANVLILEFLKEVAKKFAGKVVEWGLDRAIEILHKILDLLK